MKMIAFIIFFVLLIFSDIYSFFGIRAFLSLSQSKFYIPIYIITVIFTIIGFYLFIKVAASGFVHVSSSTSILFGIAFSFVIAKLILSSAFFVEDIMRGFLWLFQYVSNCKTAESVSRSFIWGVSALSVASVMFILMNIGVLFGKYHFKVHNIVLEYENLPENFDGFRIAQLSDLHLGTFDNPEKVKKGFDLLSSQKPDIILFTGDMVNNLAQETLPYIEMIKNLNPPFGKYTVWGNHDYAHYINWKSESDREKNLNDLVKYEQEMGLHWLNNTNVPISKNGDTIYIVGVENWGLPPFPQNGKLDKALENISSQDFVVLLSHDPTHWREKVLKNDTLVELTLSGHTHGMQFGFEIGNFRWSPVKYRYKDWAGLFSENGRKMYVNRGFGSIAYPGRVGIWPEITIIELRKK